MRVVLLTGSFLKNGKSLVNSIESAGGTLVGLIEPTPGKKTDNNRQPLPVKVFSFIDKLSASPRLIQNFASKKGIRHFRIYKQSQEETATELAALKPDVLIVYSMPYLLKPVVFKTPAHGCINIHPAYLPKYRGVNPVFWQFYYNDLPLGVTIHAIDEYSDTGSIFQQVEVAVQPGATADEINEVLINRHAAQLLQTTLTQIKNNIAYPIPQPVESPTPYARRVKPNEFKELMKWDAWPVEHVWNLLRANQKNLAHMFESAALPKGTWKVMGYVKSDRLLPAPGSVEISGRKGKVYCTNGFIEIKKAGKLGTVLERLKQLYG